ncbi:hypothetical protein S83_061335 [Arachis hypogaea]
MEEDMAAHASSETIKYDVFLSFRGTDTRRDPSWVRHQRGSYHDALANHEIRSADKVQIWRDALKEAANLSGLHSPSSSFRNDAELIDEIVKRVIQRLNQTCQGDLMQGLVGIHEPIAELESLLCTESEAVSIIGLWGMDGVGREIVREECLNDPGKRSRLWDSCDTYEVLKYNKGTQAIESITLNMSEIDTIRLHPETFERMPELKLVRFHAPNFRNKLCAPEGITSLPKKLSYFHWDEFSLKSLPSSFGVERIVEIIMPNSGLQTLWEGEQVWKETTLFFIYNSNKIVKLF